MRRFNDNIRTKKKITGLQVLNVLFVMFFLLPGSFLASSVSGITFILAVPFIICNVLLGISYKIYKADGSLKTPVKLLRVLAVLLFVVVFGIPFIGMNFNTNKAMYIPKRQIYVNGVRREAGRILPEKLPNDADNYYFRTELNYPVRDQHPYADLIFRCSEADIERYIEEAKSEGMSLVIDSTPGQFDELFGGDKAYRADETRNKEILTDYVSRYLDVPKDLLSRLESDEINHFAENGITFRYGDHSGCSFDKSAGYAIFWGGEDY